MVKALGAESFAIRVVVATLSFISVGGLVSEVALALLHTSIPDSIDRLTFAAMGALTATLTKVAAGGRHEDATQVEVVNDPEQPVPVEPT